VSTLDPHTGRSIADEALGALEAFRESGAKSFHVLGVESARTRYEASCAANGLSGDTISQVSDMKIDETCTVRVYDPRPSNEPSAVILFVHGGGWVMGSLATHDGLCRRLAARTHLPVVAVDYRLAPEHEFPAAIDDCRAALEWLSTPTVHGLEPTSIVVVGDSAGGQIAASLVIEAIRTPGVIPVVAQALLYPVTDLTSESDSYKRITSGFPLTAATMRWFADLYVPPGIDRAQPNLSPLQADLPPGMPPTFVCTVDNDPLADEGIRYAGKLSSAGTEVHAVHLAGFAHGLFTSAGSIQRGEQIIDNVARFISDCALTSSPSLRTSIRR